MIDEKMRGKHLPEERKLTCIPARQDSPSNLLLRVPLDFHTHMHYHPNHELLVSKNRGDFLKNHKLFTVMIGVFVPHVDSTSL